MKQAAALILLILYVLSPWDFIPDWLIGPGFLDDLAVALFVYFKFFKRARKTYRFVKDEFSRGKGSPPRMPPAFDPYGVLDLEHGASKDEISRQYRKLMSQYHPDKVDHLGLEFKKLAHKKALEIQRAYEMLGGAS